MAGSVSKANGRQSLKRKAKNPNWGMKRVRVHEIPLICSCGKTAVVTSAQAYAAGGNPCRCGKKFSFNTKAFPKPQIVKR